MNWKTNWTIEEKIEAFKKELVKDFKFKTIDNIKFEKIKRHIDYFGNKHLWNYGFEFTNNQFNIFALKDGQTETYHELPLKDLKGYNILCYYMTRFFKNLEKDIVRE